MAPHHVTAVQEIVHNLIRRGDPLAPELLEIALRMNEGFYPEWLLRSVVQKRSGLAFDQYDAYCFIRVLEHYYTGEMFYGSIKMDEEAHGDRFKAANNAVLARLPEHYRAEFFGGTQDNDGYLEWLRPIRLFSKVLNADGTETVARVEVAPRSVPLEVGTTLGSRTLTHLRFRGGFARWPYGQDELHVFVLRPDVFQSFFEDAPDSPVAVPSFT